MLSNSIKVYQLKVGVIYDFCCMQLVYNADGKYIDAAANKLFGTSVQKRKGYLSLIFWTTYSLYMYIGPNYYETHKITSDVQCAT